MPIPALVIDADLLPPLSDHRSRNGQIAPLNAEAFRRRFRRCACALVAVPGQTTGTNLDLVVDLRHRAPLVPLAVVTDISPEAPTLFERLTPDAIVTAPTTMDVLLAALDSLAGMAVLERLARAIDRGRYFEPSIASAVVACCRSEKPVHTVRRMVELSGLPDSTFHNRWRETRTVSPQEFLHTLELIRAVVLWEDGVLVKDLPEKLGISRSTLKRRRLHRRFHYGLAERLARELLRQLAI